MAGGFGALAAMNEAIKKNREMLKGKKEKRLKKDPLYFAKRGEALVIRSKPLSEQEKIKLIQSVVLSEKANRNKRLVVLAVAVVVTLLLIKVLIRVLNFYMS